MGKRNMVNVYDEQNLKPWSSYFNSYQNLRIFNMTRFSIISTKRFLAKLSLLEKKNMWRNGAHECFIDLDLFMVYTRLRIDCKFEITKLQGPVVQSIVSLTSSLRGQLVKCFTTL